MVHHLSFLNSIRLRMVHHLSFQDSIRLRMVHHLSFQDSIRLPIVHDLSFLDSIKCFITGHNEQFMIEAVPTHLDLLLFALISFHPPASW